MTAIHRTDSGFSIIEVLVAIVILSVGLLALAQSSGTVSRMVGRGKQDTQAAMAAQSQLEVLRRQATTTPTKCTGLTSGSTTVAASGMTTAWTVTGSGNTREVVITVTYRISRGTRQEVVRAVLGCI
jgi:prepilin-type N-terminal cleavage/methylation domain-containing protein